MEPKLKFSQRLALLIVCIIFLLSFLTILPSGFFRQMLVPFSSTASAESDHRCYLEYTVDNSNPSTGVVPAGDQTAGIHRQTLMYVYAFKGETICLGSDIYDSHLSVDDKFQNTETGADIVVVYPDSSVHPLDTQLNGIGYIGNTAQENNPPDYTGTKDDDQYYTPHMLVAPEDGIYEIRFHSYSGNRSKMSTAVHRDSIKDPAPIEKDSDDWKNSAATVGAWNVTVVDTNEPDESKQIQKGRTYTKCLCLNAGSNNIYITEQYYVVTNDGYIYRTEFSQLDPFGFVFFSNSRGLIDNETSGSAYHSYSTGIADLSNLMNKQNVSFQNPGNKDTDVDKTFRIFFEPPDEKLVGILYPKAYVPDEIRDVEFIGSKHDNISYVSDGGYFKFTVSNSTSATLTISFDNYNANNNTNYTPVVITKNAFPGENFFYWDGCDGSGVTIPVGYYESGIEISITNHAGEYHFPLFDVENNFGRIYVERVNEIYERTVGDDGIVYDKNVTNEFEHQKNFVYYNNKIVKNINANEALERNALITDPDDIEYLKKYCYVFCTELASKYENFSTSESISAKTSYHVRVFNKQATMNEFGLSSDDADDLYERICNGEDSDAVFDYYLIIADQQDRSNGMNSQTESAVPFPPYNNTYRRGDLTAIDMWTYSLGKPSQTVLKNGIIIEDIKDYRHANLQGRVFFDTNNDGRFSLLNGDYGIGNVTVEADYTYTEIRWDEAYDESTGELASLTCDKASDGNKYVLVPTDEEDVYQRYVNDEFKDTLQIRKEELPHDESEPVQYRYFMDVPVHLVTKTDANGIYNFTGILVVDGAEDPGNVEINVHRPSLFYNITTESSQSGDFDYLRGTEQQSVSLSDIYNRCDPEKPAPTLDVADVGYYYEEYEPPIILKKEWPSDASTDPGRPEHVTYHIVGAVKDAPDIYRYEDDVDIYYYDDSWQKTLAHLPSRYNGAEMIYKVLYEKFDKGGVTYYFDGENYYSDYYSKTLVQPPYYSTMTENMTHTGHILTVINAEFSRTIEITKLADDNRQTPVDGAVFKAERLIDRAADQWELITDALVTDKKGIIKLQDKDYNIEPGIYRFTETDPPDGFAPIPPFEVELDAVTAVYRKTIFEPPENVTLTLTKNFKKYNNTVIAFPDQELTFLIELAYDPDFNDKLSESFTKTITPLPNVESYILFNSIEIPNSAKDKEIYVRITEQDSGSYITSASISAKSVRLGTFDYSDTDYSWDTSDAQNKSLVFKLITPEDNGTYNKYYVTMDNDAQYANTLRFRKVWFNSSMSQAGSEINNIKAVYAKLMRTNLLTGETEQVTKAVGGTSNKVGSAVQTGKHTSVGGAYGGVIKDADYVEKGYFAVSGSAWTKNFTKETWWYFPEYAPDGGKYLYFISEVTNERGNPLCVIDGYDTPQFLYDYKVIPEGAYSEERLSVNSAGNVTKIKARMNGKDLVTNTLSDSGNTSFNADLQKNYYILNRYAPEIALQITKNQLSETNDPNEEKIPLKDAEFTLYSDSACTMQLDKIVTGENGVGEFTVPLQYGRTYYLKETKAPTGYAIDSSIIRLDYDGIKMLTIRTPDGTVEIDKAYANNEYVINITRTNTFCLTLPEAGSRTTALVFSSAGLLLMTIAVLGVLVLYRKVNSADDG